MGASSGGVSVPEGGFSVPGGLCRGGGSVRRGFLSGGFSVPGGLCLVGVYVLGDLCPGRPPYGNERAVRILLECILVLFNVVVCFQGG